jgi:formylglycine-generating enzyme required for sulfatase activity
MLAGEIYEALKAGVVTAGIAADGTDLRKLHRQLNVPVDVASRIFKKMQQRVLAEDVRLPSPSTAPSQRLMINPVDGAEMIWIPEGEFLMGDDDQHDNPRRTVKLAGYWMYKNVVTVGMYKLFSLQTGSKMPRAPYLNHLTMSDHRWRGDDHPIVNVSWNEAQAYCRWAGVSLPSEAQWEKAARGTDGRRFPWGDTFDASELCCSCDMMRRGTTAVGKYNISPYGCTDMAGNVSEWCVDYYHESYWKCDAYIDLKGPTSGDERVCRGGSWSDSEEVYFRASFRVRYSPDFGDCRFGFRGAAAPQII